MPSDIVLSWSLRVRGSQARVLSRLLVAAGSPEAVLERPPGEAAALAGADLVEVAPLLDRSPAPGLDAHRGRLEKCGARVVAICDPEYPALLREAPDPPPFLFARGRPLGDGPAVGLVGSRNATRNGLEAARLVAAGPARAGAVAGGGGGRGVAAAAPPPARAAGGGGGGCRWGGRGPPPPPHAAGTEVPALLLRVFI